MRSFYGKSYFPSSLCMALGDAAAHHEIVVTILFCTWVPDCPRSKNVLYYSIMGTRRILTATRREEAERLRVRRNPPFLSRREVLWFASHGNKAGYFVPWHLIQGWALETGRRRTPYSLLGFMVDVSHLLATEWTDKVLVVELPHTYALVFAGDFLGAWKSMFHGQRLHCGGDPKVERMVEVLSLRELRYVSRCREASLFADSWRRAFPGLVPEEHHYEVPITNTFVSNMAYSTFAASWEPYATDSFPQPQSPS